MMKLNGLSIPFLQLVCSNPVWLCPIAHDSNKQPPRPPSPEPTVAKYIRDKSMIRKSDDWSEIEIRLVGTHPLWGNYLWNAARAFASHLDENVDVYRDTAVLELGAGGGLPGLVTVLNGARKIVLTDYPDEELVQNLVYNVETNIPKGDRDRVSVQGYIWGRPIEPLFDALQSSERTPGFDLIILSDLVFNHSQHDSLLTTCELALSRVVVQLESSTPAVLVFYSHHRPRLAHRDLEFFTKARQRGWQCEEILTRKYPPMFPEDAGEEEIRSTVHGWRLTRQIN
ncbi:hypothetical protein L208DRAFT_736660 [Tricholoma matsutake]|nr:hypothetical protein L208DRAFT_736660 [Tricholoma matsutake 945]